MPDPKRGVAFTFDLALVDSVARPFFKTNPTLATGDFQISIDDGAYANVATLPTVTPAGGITVKVVLSATEMTGDRIKVRALDAAGGEWDEVLVTLLPSVAIVDDLHARLPAALDTGRIVAVAQVVSDKTGFSLADSPGIKRNTALAAFSFLMVDSSDHVTPKTGLTVTATRRLDGGAFAPCANAPTEVSGGWYTIDFAASDLNGTVVALMFTAPGADARGMTLVTEP